MSTASEHKRRGSLSTIRESVDENDDPSTGVATSASVEPPTTPPRRPRGRPRKDSTPRSNNGPAENNGSVTPTTDRPRRQSAQQAKQKINTHFTKGEPAFPALVEEEPDDLDDDFILDDDELMPKGEYGDGEDETTRRGPEIFGFRTPARSARTPMKTPLKTPSRTPLKTPTSVSRNGGGGGGAATPLTGRHAASRAVPRTPQTVRRKLGKRIGRATSRVVDGASDSDAAESTSDDDDDDDGDDGDDGDDDKDDAGVDGEDDDDEKEDAAPKSRRSAAATVENATGSTEDYFLAAGQQARTSDRTLNRLKNPRLSREAVDNLLEHMDEDHAKEKRRLFQSHRRHFPLWSLLLREGFNILAYGLGSKRQLLDRFRTERLAGGCDVVVVNGFFPGLTIKEVLDSISEGVFQHAAHFSTANDQVDWIESRLDEGDAEVYLMVHNIDGPSLQFGREQELLCRLASMRGLHLVASVDHINAPLLWDQQKLSQLRFVYFDCTTLAPYVEEISYENSLLVHQSSSLGLASLVHVFASLTFNAKAIYIVVAKRQLEHKDDPNYHGFPFHELYNTCRDQMLVNSDLTLRAQLTEFKDHKLLRSKRTADGTEVLDIPIDGALLQGFVQKYQDNL